MLFYLLEETASGATGGNNGWQQWIMWILVAVIVIVFGVWMFFSSKKRKKQEQEAKDLIDAVKPGNKVKTIGGICGIVVEVNSEENTFVLETGSETSGKSYMKFDKQAIYQTDAVVEKVAEPAIKDEVPAKDEPVQPAEGIAPELKPAEEANGADSEKPVLLKKKKDKNIDFEVTDDTTAE